MRRLVPGDLEAVELNTKGVGVFGCEGVLSPGGLFPGGADGCSELEVDVDMTLNVSKPSMHSTLFFSGLPCKMNPMMLPIVELHTVHWNVKRSLCNMRPFASLVMPEETRQKPDSLITTTIGSSRRVESSRSPKVKRCKCTF